MRLRERVQPCDGQPVAREVVEVFFDVQIQVEGPEFQVQGPSLPALSGHLRVAGHTFANSNRSALPSVSMARNSSSDCFVVSNFDDPHGHPSHQVTPT